MDVAGRERALLGACVRTGRGPFRFPPCRQRRRAGTRCISVDGKGSVFHRQRFVFRVRLRGAGRFRLAGGNPDFVRKSPGRVERRKEVGVPTIRMPGRTRPDYAGRETEENDSTFFRRRAAPERRGRNSLRRDKRPDSGGKIREFPPPTKFLVEKVRMKLKIGRIDEKMR